MQESRERQWHVIQITLFSDTDYSKFASDDQGNRRR